MAAGEKATKRISSSYAILVVADMAIAFLWIFLNAMARVAVDLGFPFIEVIAYAAAGITHYPTSVLSLRVPAQIVGAILGASAAVSSLPAKYQPMMTGPFLRVDCHVGAMVEAVLTFAVVFIALATSLKGPKSGIRKTWITSISRVSLSVLGAEYTGPAMNPANAFGWAYWKNQHNTWEHMYVYWIAPILATFAAAWIVRAVLLSSKVKEKKA
ncbi:hypothetical protein L7F22_062212 [Adiantum nelumboides]|nr:hypothetical protein [Adiantum nelumboides]